MPHPIRLSAVVLARDEERNLPGCLAALRWADERLVVVDARTRDRTREVATALGARVAEQPFHSFADFRNGALSLATGEWVFFVDADERVSPALAGEIEAAVAAAPSAIAGFWIPRLNFMFGRLVLGAGWWPDHQLRLLRRTRAAFDPGRPVHEVAVLQGSSAYLVNPLVHLSYSELSEFRAKQARYSGLAAEAQRARGRPRARALVGQPAREFWRRYVTLRGWREGKLGLTLSAILAGDAARVTWRARTGR